ncbi:hypothetical protein [Streptomyces hebeiensis]
MGWTVLYIAFGIVALWLLGEVLLQYKARLRWRLLAFGGFLGVVVGVLIPSIYVIGLGAAAFAVGQTYVTLSFRRGFATGWAIRGGKPSGASGSSRRRKGGNAKAAEREPSLEVTGLEYERAESPLETTAAFESPRDASGAGTGADPAAGAGTDERPGPGKADGDAAAGAASEAAPVYAPQPMPDETGQYGVYRDDDTDAARAGQAQSHGYGDGYGNGWSQDPYGQDVYAAQAHAGYDGYQSSGYSGHPGDPGYAGQSGPSGHSSHSGQDLYAARYDYGTDGQQYGGYADEYATPGGPADYSQGQGQGYGQDYGSYDAYDSFGGRQQYADPYVGPGQDPYARDTPPGGVWVPHQRDSDPTATGDQPPQTPYGQPQQPGYGNGDNGYDDRNNNPRY